jgi:hypothetical protein
VLSDDLIDGRADLRGLADICPQDRRRASLACDQVLDAIRRVGINFDDDNMGPLQRRGLLIFDG